jgi:hypothetical protein
MQNIEQADEILVRTRQCENRCPICGQPLRLVEVHGHHQCALCGANVEPCCQGAPGD